MAEAIVGLIGVLVGIVVAYWSTKNQIRTSQKATREQIEAERQATKLQIEASQKATDRQIGAVKEQLDLALKVFEAEISREKKEFCFRMWEMWFSDLMRESRTSLWNHLIQKSEKDFFDFASLEKENLAQWDNLGAIQHFMTDLNIMLQEDVIDKNLARLLFKETLDQWFTCMLHPQSNWGKEKESMHKMISSIQKNLNFTASFDKN